MKMEHNQTGGYGVYYVIIKWNYYLQGMMHVEHNSSKNMMEWNFP